MRSQHDEAFVLGTRALGEADLIVTLLARQHGLVRAVARSARRSRRRFGGLLETLTRVRAEWRGREGQDLQRLESVEGVRSFADMQADPLRQAACAVLTEVSAAFGREGQSDVEGFRLVGAVLEALEGGLAPAVALRYFEYWTLRLHGVLPDLGACVVCGRVVPPGGGVAVVPSAGVRCGECPPVAGEPEIRLSAADRRFLEDVRRRSPADMPADDTPARPGGPVERWLRGLLEGYAERAFHTYRHFNAAARALAVGDDR